MLPCFRIKRSAFFSESKRHRTATRPGMLQVFEDHAQFVSFSVTRRCGSPETSKPMKGLGCKCYPIVVNRSILGVIRGGRSQRYLGKKTLSDELLELGGGFKYFSFSPLFGEDSQFDDHIFQRG